MNFLGIVYVLATALNFWAAKEISRNYRGNTEKKRLWRVITETQDSHDRLLQEYKDLQKKSAIWLEEIRQREPFFKAAFVLFSVRSMSGIVGFADGERAWRDFLREGEILEKKVVND